MSRSLPILAVLLVALACAVQGQTCGYGGIDVSPLASSVMTINDPTGEYQFEVQVCGLLTTPCAGTNNSASVCRTNLNTQQSDIIAAAPQGSWSYLDNVIDNGLSEEIVGADTCATPLGPISWNAFINFVCSTEVRPPVVALGQCYYNITIYSPVACTSQPTECDFYGMNLEPLSAPVYTFNDSTQFNYTFTVCRPIAAAENFGCYNLQGTTGSACQQNFNLPTPGSLEEIGMWYSPKWSLLEPGNPAAGIQYVVAGTGTCVQPQGSQTYATTYQFPCASVQGPVQVQTEPNSCYFTFILPTPLACGGSSIAIASEEEPNEASSIFDTIAEE